MPAGGGVQVGNVVVAAIRAVTVPVTPAVTVAAIRALVGTAAITIAIAAVGPTVILA